MARVSKELLGLNSPQTGMLFEVRQAAKESDKTLGWWQHTTYRSTCFPRSGKGSGTGLGAPVAWLRLCTQSPGVSRNK